MLEEPIFSSLIAILVAFLWGLNSIFLKKGMQGEHPLRGMFLRTLFSFPFLLLFVSMINGVKTLEIYFSNDVLPLVILTSFLIVIGDSFFMLALKKYDISQILPIASIYPLFTTIILIFSGVESVSSQIILGTIVVIFGVGIVTSARGKTGFSIQSIIFGIGIALCWGTSIFYVRKILEFSGTNAIALTGIRTMFMGFFAISLYYTDKIIKTVDLGSEKDSSLTRYSLVYLALSGFVGWVFGATLFFYAVQRIGAAIPTPITSTNPIFASIIGIRLGMEKTNIAQLIGITVTVIGTIIIVI